MSATAELTENTAIARRFPEEVATKGDIDVIDEICAEDAVDNSPLGEVQGREALKAQLRSLRGAFTDFTATVVDTVAEGDRVAMRVRLTGRHDGEFMGIPATGNEFEVENMVFTRIEDGEIVERWVHPDMLGMLSQLGVVEPPLQPPTVE